jgi:DNA-binding NarL/FixJ family response regulator
MSSTDAEDATDAVARVLIVDDEPPARDELRFLLSEIDGVDVVGEATTAEEAQALIDSIAYDVVLLDVRMPGMDGFEALEQLQGHHPDLRVIVLSMHREPAYVRRAVELGACGYLLKRTSRDELLVALRAVHQGHAYVQGELVGAVVQQAVSPAPADLATQLSATQRQVLNLVADGLGNKQIARELFVSEHTVKAHLKAIFEALGVGNRAEAVAIGLRAGIIE